MTNQEFEQEVEREIESEHDGNASETEIEAAYELEYEADDWNETEVDAKTADLMEVKGDRAVRLANLSVSPGQYEAVYVEATEIEGTLKSGEQVEFNRSSGKILRRLENRASELRSEDD